MLTRPAIPPSRLVPNVPPALEALVLSALAKHPAKRPQTAHDFLSELMPFMGAGRAPSILPTVGESEAPLPLVTERPAPASQQRQTLADKLELAIETTSQEVHPLLNRKAK
jgi:hypothetical protein